MLPTGTLRRAAGGALATLPGYAEGAWWVQDAAAALPARLFGDLAGREVVDLCAAPGGKTAQLAAAGARVTAVDRSTRRLERLVANLKQARAAGRDGRGRRSDLASAASGRSGATRCSVQHDRGDPPPPRCAASQTARRRRTALGGSGEFVASRHRYASARRHSGLLHVLARARRGAGTHRVAALRRCPVERREIEPDEIGAAPEWITSAGDLRTLPCHFGEYDGIDGFFARGWSSAAKPLGPRGLRQPAFLVTKPHGVSPASLS